jgi:hypothetical protein
MPILHLFSNTWNVTKVLIAGLDTRPEFSRTSGEEQLVFKHNYRRKREKAPLWHRLKLRAIKQIE